MRRPEVAYTRALMLRPHIAAVIAVTLLTSCASLGQQFCETLYFGTSIPNSSAIVSDAEWDRFVTEVVSPRFEGFTQWNAIGEWHNEKEATHVVQFVIERDDDAAAQRKLQEIADAYKARFHQQAVLSVHTRVTARF